MPSQDNPEEQYAEEKKLLKHRIEAFNPYRKARLTQTKCNIAYLCGHQNIIVRGGSVIPIVDTDPEYYAPYNKILPSVVNDIAVSTKTSPKMDVVPAGTDEDDKGTAKAGENILKYLLRINRFCEQRKSIVLWYDIDGIGWRKVYWKPDYKVIGKNPLAGQEGHDPNLPALAPIFQGEVVTEHVPNTELIFDHRQKNNERRKWIIHAKTITIGGAKERYDDISKLDPVAIHSKQAKKDSFDAELLGDFQRLSESIAPATAEAKDSELLENDKLINYYEFWHVIDKNMPQGAYIEALGDPDKLTVMKSVPYPIDTYPHGEIPFIGYDPLALDGIAVGAVSRISQARPLQRYFNQLLQIAKENVDVMGSGIFFAPRGANLDFKKIDFGTANVIEYDGVFKPQREAGTQIPGSFFVFLDTISKAIDEIFAFHEPSKGIMPKGGPRSALGLQVLQEADATQLSPIVKALDASDERAAYQMLSLALANYQQERFIEIVGDDNQWTLQAIDPKELNGKVNVIVRTGSSLPLNKILEQEKSFTLWQSGLLGNPLDPNVRLRVLKVMDIGGFDQLLQANSKHINQAQKEFQTAEALAMQAPPTEGISVEGGKLTFSDAQTKEMVEKFLYVPPVNEFDDHYTHLQEHTNFLLDKFNKYIGSGNPILMALGWAMRTHISQHQQIITMQQMQMMAMENPKLFGDESGTKEAGKK